VPEPELDRLAERLASREVDPDTALEALLRKIS